MAWFRRPPAWTPFRERADQVTFEREVSYALRQLGLEITERALEEGVVSLPDGLRWDLVRLAEKCATTDRDTWRTYVYEDLKRQLVVLETRTGLSRLRTQIVSRQNPLFAALDPHVAIQRPIGGHLVEIAMWDLDDQGEQTVRRGDERLHGLDDEAVLLRGRAQAITVTSDKIAFQPVVLGGLEAEIAVSNAYYLGACMVEMLAHGDPGRKHLIAPVSFHHWIVHAADRSTGAATIDAMSDLARVILAETPLTPAERLGDSLYWWPGNGRPTLVR